MRVFQLSNLEEEKNIIYVHVDSLRWCWIFSVAFFAVLHPLKTLAVNGDDSKSDNGTLLGFLLFIYPYLHPH